VRRVTPKGDIGRKELFGKEIKPPVAAGERNWVFILIRATTEWMPTRRDSEEVVL
jgi:hypothetical protein